MVQNLTWEWLLEGFKFDLEIQVKPKTVEYYYSHARLFARWAQNCGCEPRRLTKRDIQLFFHQLVHGQDIIVVGNNAQREIKRSQQSRWPYYRSLKRFFGWATNEGYLDNNPMDGIMLRHPKEPPVEPYRPDDIQRILAVLDHDWRTAITPRQKMLAARDQAVVFLALESGLRLSELTDLLIGDIALGKQTVWVRQGKAGKGRMAGFGPQTKKALWRYLGLRPVGSGRDRLWVTEEGNPISKHGIQQIIRRLKKNAGLDHIKGSMHKLRHTFATIYLRHTRDMKGCRLLLGHSTLAMTERYTAFIDAEDALRAYDGKGPLDWLKD